MDNKVSHLISRSLLSPIYKYSQYNALKVWMSKSHYDNVCKVDNVMESMHLIVFLSITCITSQHFTFHWCPLPMLPSDWLRSGSYCAMYSVIVQYNACICHSLFVWLMINCLVVSLTDLEKGISWKSLLKAQNRITIYKYLQIWLDAHSWVVKNILKLNEMCTRLFV